jgi:hypothetical protein
LKKSIEKMKKEIEEEEQEGHANYAKASNTRKVR